MRNFWVFFLLGLVLVLFSAFSQANASELVPEKDIEVSKEKGNIGDKLENLDKTEGKSEDSGPSSTKLSPTPSSAPQDSDSTPVLQDTKTEASANSVNAISQLPPFGSSAIVLPVGFLTPINSRNYYKEKRLNPSLSRFLLGGSLSFMIIGFFLAQPEMLGFLTRFLKRRSFYYKYKPSFG